ncbi:MAG: hypothetical protein J2P36_17755, partial [Ktedonobacteraceae bacterium]|nr:hypothetical protein [Ktedonobacteraceae bacterium]
MKNSLYERLAYWAEHTPNHPCIVEVETARSITYAECLQAVLEIRQHIGSTPKNIFLMMPGGIVNALLWLSALTGGHTLVPLSSDTVADEARRAMTMFRPDMLFIEQDRQGKAFFPATTTVVT